MSLLGCLNTFGAGDIQVHDMKQSCPKELTILIDKKQEGRETGAQKQEIIHSMSRNRSVRKLGIKFSFFYSQSNALNY